MLAKVCLKRFRFVLYAALFFLITLHITDRTNSGLIATICIWFALPLAFIAFIWWIYACIRDIVRFFKSGAVPEDAPTWAERAVWWVQDELAEIASLDDRGKVRFFLFRVGGEYIYLYASKNRRYLHLSSNAIPEWITSGTPDGQKKDEPLDMPELLADLCDCIENYLKTGNVEGVGNVGVPPQTPPET